MERIKQALELARQERSSSGTDSNIKLSAQTRSESVADQDIQYTKSKLEKLQVNELREKRIIVDQQGVVNDAYKLLRTQILQRLDENNWNTLALTSPNTNAGKTLTAINLAISLAREVNYTVLLVDANLRSPRVHNYFGFTTEYGLSDYLEKDVPLSDILVHPEGIPRFVILPAGNAILNSSEMLSSPKMKRLVEELKTRYPSRIVLFDMPALLEGSDTLAFLPNTDASLIVIEDGKTSAQDLRQAFDLLASNHVIGTVLNKAYTRDRVYGNLDVKPGFFSRLLNKLSKKALPDWIS
ncbi:MAG: CpsD/CapB family tyrosine-protein kinase [Gammaproteobacteria bacterium]|nr:CpsD/CapB family tyrosine-protein kinase [Gammaproteobacteria bacterium]